MSKMTLRLATAVLAVSLAAPGFAQDEPTADTVVATVNGQDVTLGQMIMIRASLPEEYQQLPPDVLWQGILDQIVQQEVLAQSDTATETRRVRTALENERRSLLASEVIGQIAEDAVSDEAVRAAYEERFAEAAQGTEYNASHILVETEEEAQAIAEEVRAGADFATVARENSTGPSGPNGGSLGWFGPGMMVEPFQNAVEALEPGEISDPVETQFGWHVIKLNETRAAEAPELEEVRAQIESELQQQAVQEFIDARVEEAEITRTAPGEINTSTLNDLELLQD
ncbi:foldase protein PrsA [Citreimonas salinaria]|uniref:Parvulin-like PPIase n=1 Tax=Citreimonas salinaria TaxID=321339 RepID=A0A1H3EYD9_9RHOB|nr:peptidylprolyl isomerase [Citreimonas salinaria]SDX82979.1 peptidyl-prolyl cis-trans isomerase C [Citreimonas salinaria]